MLSLLVRHDIKLDVREDGKLLPHVQCSCFSDGIDKICLLSSIVDCDSKGFRRFSIQCFGSLLNVVTVSVREDNKLLPVINNSI